MPSHMGVQSFATARNAQVELVVQFILENLLSRLEETGAITDSELLSQERYASDIANDIWDHFLLATLPNGRRLEVWCQTTCYKGNGTGKPESNKTYEVRETLVEGLSIRDRFGLDPNTDYRTIHFTVGDSNYTYQWFMSMKAAIYDLSVYIGDSNYDIFSDISRCLAGAITEDDKLDNLRDQVSSGTKLGLSLDRAENSLLSWFSSGEHSSEKADAQWAVVDSERLSNVDKWIEIGSMRGIDIKGKVNQALFSEEPDFTDPLVSRTAAKLLSKNPFLASAIETLDSWDEFIAGIEEAAKKASDLEAFINALWQKQLPHRLIMRRLLVRVHSEEAVSYIQDRDIAGVTEHNMYSGDHSACQATEISAQIKKDLQSKGISTSSELLGLLKQRGKRMLNQARWFEAQNGTQLKPSFDYVILALEDAGFVIKKPKEAGIRAIGYHAEISQERVRPYTNLKAILSPSGKLLCILKAKFFREPEFPRRCKEEAFVGLTLKYQYRDSQFVKRFSVPLVMYIDMAADCDISEYSVKRLMSFGWSVVFSIQELIELLRASED